MSFFSPLTTSGFICHLNKVSSKPAAAQGGKLTALNGAEKSEADIKPAGGNKLEATGIKVAKGSKVVATITGVEGQTVTVRFSVK